MASNKDIDDRLQWIIDAVRRREDFNFSEVIDSFIGNAEFREGSRNFLEGQEGQPKTFVWEALSAIGQDVGSVLTESVRHYIDKVANVETCGIENLYSMIKLLGFDYSFFINIDFLPIEVKQLIDIFSIEPKYILRNGFLSKDLHEDLVSKGVIIKPEDELNGSDFRISYGIFDDDRLSDIGIRADLSDVIRGAKGGISCDTVYGGATISAVQISGLQVLIRNNVAFGVVSVQVPETQAEELPDNMQYIDGTVVAPYTISSTEDVDGICSALEDAQFDYEAGFVGISGTAKITNVFNIGNMVFADKDDGNDGDSGAYYSYVRDTFHDLLSGFLGLHYCVDENSPHADDLVRNDIGQYDGYFDTVYGESSTDEDPLQTKINLIKKAYGIEKFDQKSIVDDIDAGRDFLENYEGPKLEILNIEIQRRVKPRFTENIVDSRLSRYSHYRKAKVLEYARFIDNRMYQDMSETGGVQEYKVDKNYIVASNPRESNGQVLTIGTNPNTGNPEVQVDETMVDNVANKLLEVTKYMLKLRRTIVLQTRKNYMKGTANLIRFVVNQFLRDYALYRFDIRNIPQDVNQSIQKLKEHELSDVLIQEYFDETEYFNLSTETTPYARNQNLVNRRFFEQFFHKDEYGTYINTTTPTELDYGDITRFYTDTLGFAVNSNLCADEDRCQELLGFLDTIYEMGANPTYFSKRYGNVQTRLFSRLITESVIERLNNIQNAFDALLSNVNEYLSGQIPEVQDTISVQISSLNDSIVSVYSEMCLSGVNQTHDAYIGDVERISSDIFNLSTDYGTYLSGDNLFYFAKSNYRYCYEYVDGGKGEYRHDWFVDNPAYEADFIQDKIFNLKNFSQISTNIRNWEILDTIVCLLDGYGEEMEGYRQLKVDLYDEILKDLSSYGYAILGTDNLETEMDSIDQFLDLKIQQRQEILQAALDSMKEQAKEMQTNLNALHNTFATVAAKLPDYSDGYMLIVGKGAGSWSRTQDLAKCQYYDKFSGEMFYEKGGGSFEKMSGPGGIDDSAPFAKRVEKAYEIASIAPYTGSSKLFLASTKSGSGESASRSNVAETIGQPTPMQYSAKDAINSIKGDLKLLNPAWDSISAQVSNLFGLDVGEEVGYIQEYVETEDIQALLEFLNSKITEKEFQKDSVIKNYNRFKIDMLRIRTSYDITKDVFESFWSSSSQQTFLAEYGAGKTFTEKNLLQLSTYTVGKDEEVRDEIKKQIDEFQDRNASMISDFVETFSKLKVYTGGGSYRIYDYDGDMYIELMVQDAKDTLDYDVMVRTSDANLSISIKIDELMSIRDILEENLFCDQYMSANYSPKWYQLSDLVLSTVISDEIERLSLEQTTEFKLARDMFDTYGGLSTSFSPWYNYKNLTHPSFQSHPFLLNFVKKNKTRSRNMSIQYAKIFSDDAVTETVVDSIDKYIGKFGNSIDAWKTNALDFSGYVTDYERSSHVSNRNMWSEVVDYEGGFYPPAVDAFLDMTTTNSRSVFDHQKLKSLCDTVRNRVDGRKVAEKVVESLPQGKKLKYGEILNTTRTAILGYMPESMADNINSVVNSFITDVCLCADYTKFDGPFNLSTMESYEKWIRENLSKSFYERFYAHLGLTEYEAGLEADRLSVWQRDIRDVANNSSTLYPQNVRDIYKYGKDQYKNHYILYKTYPTSLENTDFQTKRNTPGTLWVRRKDHPIAFPATIALSGSSGIPVDELSRVYAYSNICYSSPNYSQTEVNRYIFNHTNGKFLNGKCIYDFEISEHGNMIALVHPEEAYTAADATANVNKGYSQADVCMSYIHELHDDILSADILAFTTNVNIDGMVKQHITNVLQDQLNTPEIAGKHRMLVGTCFGSKNEIRIGYVVGMQSQGSLSGGRFALYTIDGNSFRFNRSQPEFRFEDGSMTWNNNHIAFSVFDDRGEQFLDLYTVPKREFGVVESQYFKRDKNEVTPSNVDMESNPAGFSIYDDTKTEMNSHDAFIEGCLRMNRFVLNGYDCIQTDGGTNYSPMADMGYIPLYPGENGQIYLGKKFEEFSIISNYNSIELLGDSKNLDSEIEQAVMSPDPYLREEDFLLYEAESQERFMDRNNLVGRIFEDWGERGNSDRTLRIKTVPYIQKYPGNTYSSYDFSISGMGFTQDDLGKLNVAVFNRRGGGLNPYYVGPLEYVGLVKTNYLSVAGVEGASGAEGVNEEILQGQGYGFQVGGTFSYTDATTRSRRNAIYNVKDIVLTYDPSTTKLRVQFEYTDPNEYACIPADEVVVAVYSDTILDQFWCYHLMDVYGLVRSTKFVDYPSDIFEDNWTLVYSKDKVKKDEWQVRHDLSSYYLFRNTGVDELSNRIYLKDIDLSDYNYLSDVYVLNCGVSSLSFKYDEEVRLDLQGRAMYLPQMFNKYPMTPGEQFKEMWDSDAYGKRGPLLGRIFGDTNLYSFCLEDAQKVMRYVNIAKVPLIQNSEVYEVEVYEDYFRTSADIENKTFRSTLLNYQRFAQRQQGFNQSGDELDFPSFVRMAGHKTCSTLSNHYIHDRLPRVDATDIINQWIDIKDGNKGTLSAMTMERNLAHTSQKYVTLTGVSAMYEHFQKYMTIYANYKKESDGSITLYFNYGNYLNSPFDRVDENGHIRSDVIEDSYLSVRSGESGILNIYAQLKFVVGDELVGFTNGRILSYEIHNVSDDKPKFVIRKIYQPTELDGDRVFGISQTNHIEIKLPDIHVDYADTDEFEYPVHYTSTVDIASTLRFDIYYPEEMLSCTNYKELTGLEQMYNTPGFIHLEFAPGEASSKIIKFKIAEKKGLKSYVGSRYMIDIDDVEIDDDNAELEYEGGSIRLVYSGNMYLVTEDSQYVKERKNLASDKQVIIAQGRLSR